MHKVVLLRHGESPVEPRETAFTGWDRRGSLAEGAWWKAREARAGLLREGGAYSFDVGLHLGL